MVACNRVEQGPVELSRGKAEVEYSRVKYRVKYTAKTNWLF